MIELQTIIDAASFIIKEGELILHKSMRVHPQFKVYKKFCYDLYYVLDNKKTLALSYHQTEHCPSDKIEIVWQYFDKLYLRELIKWFAGNEYKALLKNEVQ